MMLLVDDVEFSAEQRCSLLREARRRRRDAAARSSIIYAGIERAATARCRASMPTIFDADAYAMLLTRH